MGPELAQAAVAAMAGDVALRTIAETAELLGIGRSAVYRLAVRGELEMVKVASPDGRPQSGPRWFTGVDRHGSQ